MRHNYLNSVYFKITIFIKHIYFKLMGLSPWSLNTTKDNSKKQNYVIICVFSYFGSIYNIFLALGIASLTIIRLYENFDPIYKDSLMSLSFVASYHLVSMMGISFVILYYTIQQKKLIIVFSEISKLDKLSYKCGFSSIKNRKFIINLIFSIDVIVRVVLILIEWYRSSLWRSLSNCCTMVFFGCIVTQYIIILEMIDERFKLINSNIIKLCNKEVESIIPEPSFIALPSQLRRSVLVDVISIRKAYNKLCNICNKTADFYGVPLLITLIYNSILLMNALYFGIISYFGMNDPLPIEERIRGVIVMWFSTQFVILTSYASKIINQVCVAVIF